MITLLFFGTLFAILAGFVVAVNFVYESLVITISLSAIIIIVSVVFLLYKSIKIVREDEWGVRILLGKIIRQGANVYVEPGIYFLKYPFEEMRKFAKSQMGFHFKVKGVVTPKGKVRGYGEVNSSNLIVDCSLFCAYDEEKLDMTIANAPGNTAKALAPNFIAHITAIVKALGGRLPWRLLFYERHASQQWVLARLVPGVEYPEIGQDDEGNVVFWTSDEIDPVTKTCREPKKIVNLIGSPFEKFGLKDVVFVIKNVSFTDPKMEEAVSAPEKARLQRIADQTEADAKNYAAQTKGEVEINLFDKKSLAEAEDVKRKGSAQAEARKLMIQEIEKNPELEALRVFGELANSEGKILYNLPNSLDPSKIIEAIKGKSNA